MSEIYVSSELSSLEDIKPLPKSARTRAAILEEAVGFLWSNQFRDLSVSVLMALLPVGRSAFYQYFADLHELMKALLDDLEHEIVSVANPWLAGEKDALPALRHSLSELVRVCYTRGPILRAVRDAAVSDPYLEQAWQAFLGRFDSAVAARIRMDQESGLIDEFDADLMAFTLNRMDAATLIEAFGRRPRQSPEEVLKAIQRVWIASLYGEKPG